jgi:hypothetical protein
VAAAENSSVSESRRGTLPGSGLRDEALDRFSAGRRNLAAVGGKASADALAVRDELGADCQGVCHAGPLVGWRFGILGLGVLGLRSDGGGSKRHAESHKRKREAGFHKPSEEADAAASQVMQRLSAVDTKQMKKPRESSWQL